MSPRDLTDDEVRILLLILVLSAYVTIVGSNGFRALVG